MEKVIIGNCTLYHGDCLDILADIPMVDLIVTDPPYGKKYKSNGGPRVSAVNRHTIQERTTILNDQFVDVRWFPAMYGQLKERAAAYVFCDFEMYSIAKTTMTKANFTLKTPLVWDKGNCGMGDLQGDYGNQTELILYGTKGRHLLNGRRDRNLLTYQRPADAFRKHPHQKPTGLLNFLIVKSSRPGDLVLDLFMGSGSTGVACIETGRKFIGIELDRQHFDTACSWITEASR
jgi:site-specific DNA-methyltransferase (adenine-specific)